MKFMKKVDWLNLFFLMLFIMLFTTLDYNNLDWLDIATMCLAGVWFILALINLILKWRI